MRFDRTPATIGGPSPEAGADNDRVLAELGLAADEIEKLRADGTIG